MAEQPLVPPPLMGGGLSAVAPCGQPEVVGEAMGWDPPLEPLPAQGAGPKAAQGQPKEEHQPDYATGPSQVKLLHPQGLPSASPDCHREGSLGTPPQRKSLPARSSRAVSHPNLGRADNRCTHERATADHGEPHPGTGRHPCHVAHPPHRGRRHRRQDAPCRAIFGHASSTAASPTTAGTARKISIDQDSFKIGRNSVLLDGCSWPSCITASTSSNSLGHHVNSRGKCSDSGGGHSLRRCRGHRRRHARHSVRHDAPGSKGLPLAHRRLQTPRGHSGAGGTTRLGCRPRALAARGEPSARQVQSVHRRASQALVSARRNKSKSHKCRTSHLLCSMYGQSCSR